MVKVDTLCNILKSSTYLATALIDLRVLDNAPYIAKSQRSL